MKKTIFSCLVGLLAISSNAQDANGRWYSAGEIQSKAEVKYGRMQFRMYSSDMSGTTSTFFMWKNGSTEANVQWNEIDVETFGKSANSWQSNPIWEYETNDYNPRRWEGFHNAIPIANTWVTFTVEWTPNYIAWFNNGVEVRRILKGQNAPQGNDPVGNINDAMRMCFNHWATFPGTWLGPFNAAQLPSFQFVDWFTYQAWNGTGFNPVSIRHDYNNIGEVTNAYTVSGHTFGDNQCTFQAANVGVVNGMLWLSITGYNNARPPQGNEIPSAGVVTPPAVVYNHVLPKKVEAEQFNAQVGIQTETTTDAGAGQNIGFTDAGDYMEYAIEAPTTGNYTVDFRVASLAGNAGFAVAVDGVTRITEVAVAATGGWQNWVTVNNTLALTAGKHILRLNVTKAGFNLIWMDFKAANTPPTVNISAPLTGATFTSGTTITLTANAADVAPGTVSSVAFYDGAVLLGTDLTSPYSFTWAGAGVGSHVITARATDNNGAVTTSAAVTLTVNAIVVTDPLTQSFYLMKDVLTKDYMRPTLGSGTATITQYEEAVQPTFDSYQWEFRAAAGGFYYIINKWTKNAIQPTNALVAENTGLSQVAFANQVADEVLWSILPTGGGYYWIKNKKSGLYIRPFNATDGGQGTVAIVQNTLVAGYSSFQWELLPVATKVNAREFTEEVETTSEVNHSFSIYPNPASDLINLSAETAWELMDLSGVTLLSGNGKQINSTGLSSGVYLIKANGKMHKLNIAK